MGRIRWPLGCFKFGHFPVQVQRIHSFAKFLMFGMMRLAMAFVMVCC
jgi:hypothetical protein